MKRVEGRTRQRHYKEEMEKKSVLLRGERCQGGKKKERKGEVR